MKQTKHVFLLAMVVMLAGAFCPDKRDVKSEQQREQPDGAVRMRIGNNDYLTFVYGGKRWMVENSKEGTPSGIAYGRDANGNPCYGGGREDDNNKNGYYYTWEQAATACPDGWTLPTKQDAQALCAGLTADTTGRRWWGGLGDRASNASAGLVGYGDGALDAYWILWGRGGCWWSSGNLTCIIVTEKEAKVYDEIGHVIMCSVRCVQN
jgi:uncharacterized protein (TIGR02145 family)